MTRLIRVSLGGFKSIRELQNLDLRPVNVLIGANGAGKSNLVSYFRLLRALGAGKLQEFVGRAGGINRMAYYGAKSTPRIWNSLHFAGKTGDTCYNFWLEATATDSVVFLEETVLHQTTKDSPTFPERLGGGHKESRLLEHGGTFRGLLDALAGVRIFHFHDTSALSAVRLGAGIHDNRELLGDASNLASFLRGLRKAEPAYYRRIVDAVRLILPFFDDFSIEPLADNPDRVTLTWRDRDSEHVFGPDQLSDGSLRAIALIALLHQPEERLPPVIILDEPELGLHPYAIEVLAGLIRSASVHSTVLAATHSTALVNQFGPEEVIVVNRERSQSEFRRLDRPQLAAWLEDYTLGEIWEKNLIGGTPTR